MSFQETLLRLAMIDESFVEHDAGLALGLAGISALDAKTASLLQRNNHVRGNRVCS